MERFQISDVVPKVISVQENDLIIDINLLQ